MTSKEAFGLVAGYIDYVDVDDTSEFWASSWKLQLCDDLESVHEEIPRVHAHVFHYPDVVCVVRDFELLPDEHKVGILLHEFGHILAPSEHDADADLWVEEFCGIDVEYVDTLQWVKPALLLGGA